MASCFSILCSASQVMERPLHPTRQTWTKFFPPVSRSGLPSEGCPRGMGALSGVTSHNDTRASPTTSDGCATSGSKVPEVSSGRNQVLSRKSDSDKDASDTPWRRKRLPTKRRASHGPGEPQLPTPRRSPRRCEAATRNREQKPWPRRNLRYPWSKTLSSPSRRTRRQDRRVFARNTSREASSWVTETSWSLHAVVSTMAEGQKPSPIVSWIAIASFFVTA